MSDKILRDCPYCHSPEHLGVYDPDAKDPGLTHWRICNACLACGPVKSSEKEANEAWGYKA